MGIIFYLKSADLFCCLWEVYKAWIKYCFVNSVELIGSVYLVLDCAEYANRHVLLVLLKQYGEF